MKKYILLITSILIITVTIFANSCFSSEEFETNAFFINDDYKCNCVIYLTDIGESVFSKAQIGFRYFILAYIYVEEAPEQLYGASSRPFGPFFYITRPDLGISMRGFSLFGILKAKGEFLGYPITCSGVKCSAQDNECLNIIIE